jgi:hypothetical protein
VRGRFAKLAVLAAALGAWLAIPAASQAEVPIYSLKPATNSSKAGGHANTALSVEVGVRGVTEPVSFPCICNTLRDLRINTPAGLIAAPGNISKCTAAEFAIKRCPTDSQLGLAVISFFPEESNYGYTITPLYNMQPREDQLALLAAVAPESETPIYTDVTSRTESDYGLEFKTFGIPSILPPNLIATIFWGVPGDSVHDAFRVPFEGISPHPGTPLKLKTFECGNDGVNPTQKLLEDKTPSGGEDCGWDPIPSNSPIVPFVQNPTACLGETVFNVQALAYDLETSEASAPFPATTGCDQLSFDPSLSAKPTTTEADSPSGLDVNVNVPQTLSSSTPTASAIREAKVTLPEGFTINANAADGKSACTAAQAKFGTRLRAECPEEAKVGTMAIESTQFPSLLHGAMYLGEPLPGNRYRIFWAFDGFSLHVKLAGTATADPETGQLVTTFTDLPQFNFQNFNLHFFGAERAILATPEQCGTYPVQAEFTPWAYPEVPKQTSTQFFTIDSGPDGSPCPNGSRPFHPSFTGGVSDNTAGAHAPFSVDITRPDGDQTLTAINVKTPPGFSATLKGIPYCPESSIAQLQTSLYTGLQELASPSCPRASRVGTVIAGAGAGSKPLHVAGKVYWAGPYKGAPLSLVIVVPAVSGPYDLGNVVNRVALNVDPVTAQVSAVSDPLPRILEGIPLRTRRILVNLDRKDFALNPTNCNPLSVDALALGDEGATSTSSSHFQVANCAVLPFKPKLNLRMTGGLNRRGHPAIHAVLRTKPGEANFAGVSVTLPKGQLLDNSHIQTVCTRVDFAKSSCPPGSRLGRAEVTTPILDQPLKGGVYLRSSQHQLPDLVLDLEGQVDFEAAAKVDSVNGRLRTTFVGIPDVPVSQIVVDLAGGKKGLLINSQGLCGVTRRASVRLLGQNGKRISSRTKLTTSCGNARESKRGIHAKASIAQMRRAG